jgi:broad specificity phosphatase PhoE
VNLWLARHGQAVAPPGVAIGRTDVPLAAAGRRQARELAERLAGVTLARIYASDLRRSRETAEPVATNHGLPLELTADLRELDFGAWEGRRLADLWIESPAEASEWESDLRRVPSSFGETFTELEARVSRFAAGLPRCGDALVVAHRGSLAVLYAQLSGASVATAWTLAFELGGLTRLELS